MRLLMSSKRNNRQRLVIKLHDKEEEQDSKGRTVHDDSRKAQPKLGKHVRFKSRLWIVKDYKEDGAIEIESPHLRRVKEVDRKQLMSWCDDRKIDTNIKDGTAFFTNLLAGFAAQGWPPHRARDSRLQYSKGKRRNQINPIPASSFPLSMSNTSSLSKIVWREEQAQASRAGAAEAPAMEEEDEDDNFEDAKEGEEKDSDDSMS
ncbi:hypothetical protein LR48_Vigan07g118900 [Vigna angularis]|uniref:Uncharacterized protein n=1 Tax=Phaseolus angularis TaxID=3914 RepID=A0A0L9UXC1_PHAAN|nr:hypothetical protein LR48_Vigan07g118900 [Vigna angularis]